MIVNPALSYSLKQKFPSDQERESYCKEHFGRTFSQIVGDTKRMLQYSNTQKGAPLLTEEELIQYLYKIGGNLDVEAYDIEDLGDFYLKRVHIRFDRPETYPENDTFEMGHSYFEENLYLLHEILIPKKLLSELLKKGVIIFEQEEDQLYGPPASSYYRLTEKTLKRKDKEAAEQLVRMAFKASKDFMKKPETRMIFELLGFRYCSKDDVYQHIFGIFEVREILFCLAKLLPKDNKLSPMFYFVADGETMVIHNPEHSKFSPARIFKELGTSCLLALYEYEEDSFSGTSSRTYYSKYLSQTGKYLEDILPRERELGEDLEDIFDEEALYNIQNAWDK
jgi:hypothetical protein